MRKPMPRKSRLSVSVTKDQREVLDKIARSSDLSVSRVAQEAIREFIERYRDREFRPLARTR